LRTRALTLLMLTLAITSVLLEVANKWTTMTGGADGLSGVTVAPILGYFKFDLFGKTAFVYCLIALFLGWWLVRRLIYSPFGPVVYLIAQDYLAKQFPEYWYFGIGFILVLVVMFAPGGILGLIDKWLPFFKPRSSVKALAR